MRFEKQLIKAAVCGAMLSLVGGVAAAQEVPERGLIVQWSAKAKQARALGILDRSATPANALYDVRARYAVSMASKRTIGTGAEVFGVGRDIIEHFGQVVAACDDLIACNNDGADWYFTFFKFTCYPFAANV